MKAKYFFTKSLWGLALLGFTLFSCQNEKEADAMGSFEADEIIVSAQTMGTLIRLDIEEGMPLKAGEIVGKIDDKNTELQKVQVEAGIRALEQKTADLAPQVKWLQDQIAVQQSQLKSALKEQNRIQKLYQQNAATGKQLDDVQAQVDVLRKQITATQQQIQVTKSNIHTQNRSILSEQEPLRKKVNIIQDQMDKSRVTNPIQGKVLTKYMYVGEFVTIGKPLYKIADTRNIYLRAYVDQTQLSEVKIGQRVKVRLDTKGGYKYYEGTVSWMNDQAEFTPKTIQTKDERENLVYAMKVKVPNDGGIKIGMYGEVVLKESGEKSTN